MQASAVDCRSTLRTGTPAGGSCTSPAWVAMATSDAQEPGDEIAMAPRQERLPGAGGTLPILDATVLINKGM